MLAIVISGGSCVWRRGQNVYVPEKQRQTTTHQTCSDFLIDNISLQRTPVGECTTLDDIFLNKSDKVNVTAVYTEIRP